MTAATATDESPNVAPAHPEGRISPIKFGMVVFIASEAMFFAALFGAWYTLRAQSLEWPPAEAAEQLGLTLAVIATIVLFISSFTMHGAVIAQRRDSKKGIVIFLVATILLAIAFLFMKVYEMWTADVGVNVSAFGTMFETLLGFHGLHMVAGISMMVVVLMRLTLGAYDKGKPKPASLDAVGYYWHFVDVVWLGVFTTIWLVK